MSVLKALSPNIEFFEMDAFELIRQHLDRRDVVYFIDPPSTAGNGKRAGKRLYEHNELDHDSLFDLLGKANGLVLMICGDSPAVVEMANRRGISVERVRMKNAHHEKKCELLISNSAQTI